MSWTFTAASTKWFAWTAAAHTPGSCSPGSWRNSIPDFLDHATKSGLVEMAPDADATVEDMRLIRGFVVAVCPACGGALKPDFVYFGENVPKDRVERAYAMVDEAGALLVAGSSLTVMSGLRFVRHAAKQGKPVVIINRGQTRGDELATIKLEAGVSQALAWLAAELPPVCRAAVSRLAFAGNVRVEFMFVG